MEKPIDRPTKSGTLVQARKIARTFHYVLSYDEASDRIMGATLEMPGVMGSGITAGACFSSVTESAVAGIAYLIEEGKEIPKPVDL